MLSNRRKSEGGKSTRTRYLACDSCRFRKVRCSRRYGDTNSEACVACKQNGKLCMTDQAQFAMYTAKRRINSQNRLEAEKCVSETRTLNKSPVVSFLLEFDKPYRADSQNFSKLIVPQYCEMFSGEAKRRLYNSAVRQEFTVSLLETYFSTVHVRCPIFDPNVFLEEFHKQMPDTLNAMLDPVVAVTLAWGALFSKHPILNADRDETFRKTQATTRRQSKILSTELAAGRKSHGNQTTSLLSPAAISRLPTGRKRGKSRIVDDLLTRAEEVLDFTKVHRIAHTTNIIAAFLADGLFPGARRCNANEVPHASGGLADVQRSFWLEVAISHMLELGINRQRSLNELDQLHDFCGKARLDMIWWFACVSDARQSALCQRRPRIDIGDDNLQITESLAKKFWESSARGASIRRTYKWLQATEDECYALRLVYHNLWSSQSNQEGISALRLKDMISTSLNWKHKHLIATKSFDTRWPHFWTFADVISACSTEINYHVIWILMWRAVKRNGVFPIREGGEEHGLRRTVRHESNSISSALRTDPGLDVDLMIKLPNIIHKEAMEASLRCARLSKMLHESDYLLNEIGTMKLALREIGLFLAEQKCAEVVHIIDGLKQYAQVFGECSLYAHSIETHLQNSL